MFEVDFKILNQKGTPAIHASTLATRPAAGFVGRLFVATDSPYGVFRDTGTAWVQVASNGGGGGSSTGVNGLNGTTNIGLGGTLANFTQINGNTNSLTFRGIDTFTIDQTNNIDIKSIPSAGVAGGRLNLTSTKTDLFFGLTGVSSSTLNITAARIKSLYGIGQIGLDLNFGSGKFVLGDYNNDQKYNSIVVKDTTDEFYFTTSYNQANTDQDLFYAINSSAGSRFVKIGDFNAYQNNISLVVDDSNYRIFTTGSNANKGFYLDFDNEIYTFGDNNAEIICDNLSQSIKLNTNNLLLSGTITDIVPPPINPLYLIVNVNGNDYKILMNRI